MLSRMAIPAVIALALLLCARTQAQISAAADPRVEFFSAVARTAKLGEYRTPAATSPYSERVDALFKGHDSHPVFLRIRQMRKMGFSYDAIMSLALHVTAPPELKERIPFDTNPPRLDKRLALEQTRALLEELRDLSTKVKWAEFYASEQPLYQEAAKRLADAANARPLVPWFDKELGVRQGASYQLVPGLLNGGQCYGAGVQFTDGTPEELRPVIGCWKWDAAGVPVFDESIIATVAHELCHSYTNPVIDRHAAELGSLGDELHALSAKEMNRMAYTTGRIVLYETLVRAMVIRFMKDNFGAVAGANQAREDLAAGFLWVPAVAQALEGYTADRTKYPTIDAFLPTFKATLDAELARLRNAPAEQKRAPNAAAPKLLKSEPADGATELAPGPITLRLEFDRPMRTDSYSVTGSPDEVPKDLKLKGVENIGQVWHLTMTLEPGRTYTIGLNGGGRRGFKSAAGIPLEPVTIKISTKK